MKRIQSSTNLSLDQTLVFPVSADDSKVVSVITNIKNHLYAQVFQISQTYQFSQLCHITFYKLRKA